MQVYSCIGLVLLLTATLSTGYIASNARDMESELQEAYNKKKMVTRLQEFKDLLVRLMMSSVDEEKAESEELCDMLNDQLEISKEGNFIATLTAYVEKLKNRELRRFFQDKVIPDLESVSSYSDELQFDLMTLYRSHPSMKDIECNADVRAAFAEHIRDVYEKMLNNFQQDASTFVLNYLPFFLKKGNNLRRELDLLCRYRNNRFCQLERLAETYDTIQEYLDGSRENWKYVVLRLQLLKVELWDPKNVLRPLTLTISPHKSNIYASATELLVNEFRQEDFAEIMALITEYPAIECRGSDFESCLLKSLVELLGEYVASTMESESQEQRTKIVYANIDYNAYLTQRALTEVIQVTRHTQTGLTKVGEYINQQIQCSGNRLASGIFAEARNYFSALHTFDKEKATYDVQYIQTTLDQYRELSTTLSKKVDSNVNAVLEGAVNSAVSNLAYQTAKSAITIAENANPLGWLFGSNDAADVLEALEDVADAFGTYKKAESLVKLLNNLKYLMKTVREGYTKNADYLSMVSTLVENIDKSDDKFGTLQEEFLESYRDYAPAVTVDQITEIGSTLAAVVEQACNIIQETTGPPVVIQIYKIYAGRECVAAAVQIERLRAVYEEIYNFQFELIETLASVVRAKTGLHAANRIGSSWETAVAKCDDTDALNRYAMLGGITYVTYNIEKWRAIEEYCNRLEYENGGTRPGACTGRSTDVAHLVSFRPESCVGHTSISGIYSIPAKIDTFSEAASFKVPDSDWLIQHDFIQPHEKDYAIYVRRFEIYLPVESSTQTTVVVRASSVSNNQLVPGGTTYPIFPNRPLDAQYLEGHDIKCFDSYQNPYTQCDSTSLPDICRLSKIERDFIAPSIYSEWSLQVTGYEMMTETIRPATNTSILVSMDICKKSRIGQVQHDSTFIEENALVDTMQSLNKCCSQGQYWSSEMKTCASCPNGTETAFHGYFCKDIDECQEGSECEESCYNTIGSFECSCKDGYLLDFDGFSCNDLDECAEGIDRCEQICINEIGSYSCSCENGTLRDDGYQCIDYTDCISVIEFTARTGSAWDYLFATEILPAFTALRVDVDGRKHFATIGGTKWFKSNIKKRYSAGDFRPRLPSCLKKGMIENVFLSDRGIDDWFVSSATTRIEVGGKSDILTNDPRLRRFVRWGKNIRLTMV